MKSDKLESLLKQEFSRLEGCRLDDFNSVLILMMNMSESIVDEYKRFREEDKKSDSRFRFWTYVPSVERGAASVVIRWRRYKGQGPRSSPVATSAVVNFKMPISKFDGCTRAEKRAIVHAESRFAKIRKMNSHLLVINKSHKALVDIVGGSSSCAGNVSREITPRNQSVALDMDEADHVKTSDEFTEADRIAFRKKIGLDR
jgi:hypothetical protein